ncbi:MAG: Rab family GTPase [Candidatus Hodarchaeota archaeon]
MSLAPLKLIIAGDGGVGKTTLLRRYVEGTYEHSTLTVGSDFASKTVNMNHTEIQAIFWDFGGEPRFRMLFPSFCNGAHGAVLVFDISRFVTFNSLEEWLTLIREVEPNIPIILIGSKCDLNRSVDFDTAQAFADSHKIESYFEVSAQSNTGVQDALRYIIRRAFECKYNGHSKPNNEETLSDTEALTPVPQE